MSTHVTIFFYAGVWICSTSDASQADREEADAVEPQHVQKGHSRYAKIWLSFTWGYLDRRKFRRDRRKPRRCRRTMVDDGGIGCATSGIAGTGGNGSLGGGGGGRSRTCNKHAYVYVYIYICVCVTCDRLDLCTTSRSFKIILLQVPHWPHWLHRSRSQRPGPVLIMIEYDWTIKIHWKAYHVRIVPVCAVAAPISPWWQPDRRHIWILHIEKLKKKHMWECRPSEAVGDWFSIYLSIFLSIFLSLSLSLSVCLSVSLSISCLSASLKTKKFCETFSCFKVDNIQNEAIPRDSPYFWIWQHQKQMNSARLPSKMESWVQSWQPRTNAFCDLSTPPV